MVINIHKIEHGHIDLNSQSQKSFYLQEEQQCSLQHFLFHSMNVKQEDLE